jgi:hypothetical protein
MVSAVYTNTMAALVSNINTKRSRGSGSDGPLIPRAETTERSKVPASLADSSG